MRIDLIVKANKDPRLSVRARGVLSTLVTEYDRVIPADELWKVCPNGRDSLRAAYLELKEAGYIVSKKIYIEGRWTTSQAFPNAGFSGVP